MQSNTSSKQATTALVNKTILTSEAPRWERWLHHVLSKPIKTALLRLQEKAKFIVVCERNLALHPQPSSSAITSKAFFRESNSHSNMATSQLLSSKLSSQKDFWNLLPSIKFRNLCVPWVVCQQPAIEEAFLRHEVLLTREGSVMLHPLFIYTLEGFISMDTPYPVLPLYRG